VAKDATYKRTGEAMRRYGWEPLTVTQDDVDHRCWTRNGVLLWERDFPTRRAMVAHASLTDSRAVAADGRA
jgi:hypothetical protein